MSTPRRRRGAGSQDAGFQEIPEVLRSDDMPNNEEVTVTPEVEVEKPVENSVTPEIEVEKPVENSVTPEIEVEKPVENSVTPEIEVEKPVENSATPEIEVEKPVENSATPEIEVEKPVENSATPEIEVEKPIKDERTKLLEKAENRRIARAINTLDTANMVNGVRNNTISINDVPDGKKQIVDAIIKSWNTEPSNYSNLITDVKSSFAILKNGSENDNNEKIKEISKEYLSKYDFKDTPFENKLPQPTQVSVKPQPQSADKGSTSTEASPPATEGNQKSLDADVISSIQMLGASATLASKGENIYNQTAISKTINSNQVKAFANNMVAGGDNLRKLKELQETLKSSNLDDAKLSPEKRKLYEQLRDMDIDAFVYGLENPVHFENFAIHNMATITSTIRELINKKERANQAESEQYSLKDHPELANMFQKINAGIEESARKLVEDTGSKPENVADNQGKVARPGLLSALAGGLRERNLDKKAREAQKALQLKFNDNGPVFTSVKELKESASNICQVARVVNDDSVKIQAKLNTLPEYKNYIENSDKIRKDKFGGDRKLFDNAFFSNNITDPDMINLKQQRDHILDTNPDVNEGLKKIRNNFINMHEDTVKFSNSSASLCMDKDISDTTKLGVDSITRHMNTEVSKIRLPEGIEPKESKSRLSKFKESFLETFKGIINAIKNIFVRKGATPSTPAPSSPGM